MESIDTADQRYMRLALLEADKALVKDEVPIGAIIVCGDRVIARAHNLVETLHDPTAHAEMQAITAATDLLGGKYLKGCVLYVTIEPCAMCATALGWAQIDQIVFGAQDPKKGYRKMAPGVLHPKALVREGVLAEECSALVSEFFKGKR